MGRTFVEEEDEEAGVDGEAAAGRRAGEDAVLFLTWVTVGKSLSAHVASNAENLASHGPSVYLGYFQLSAARKDLRVASSGNESCSQWFGQGTSGPATEVWPQPWRRELRREGRSHAAAVAVAARRAVRRSIAGGGMGWGGVRVIESAHKWHGNTPCV